MSEKRSADKFIISAEDVVDYRSEEEIRSAAAAADSSLSQIFHTYGLYEQRVINRNIDTIGMHCSKANFIDDRKASEEVSTSTATVQRYG
uniref:Carn_acyltransf domain-containing protein n=1 Tax=Syphacia muris TaxID=451379 RepID=A0A0N5AJM9_9BILA